MTGSGYEETTSKEGMISTFERSQADVGIREHHFLVELVLYLVS